MRIDVNTHRKKAAVRILVLLVVCLSGCQESVELPDSISGTYVTRHPTYDDRSFTLTPTEFSIQIDEKDSFSYPIREVLVEPNGQGPHMDLYTLVYANKRGQEYKLRFYLEDSARKALVFNNQPEVVWTKKDGRL